MPAVFGDSDMANQRRRDHAALKSNAQVLSSERPFPRKLGLICLNTAAVNVKSASPPRIRLLRGGGARIAV
jgi:hypothetical protein